jgi:hypothetical protein
VALTISAIPVGECKHRVEVHGRRSFGIAATVRRLPQPFFERSNHQRLSA